MYKDYLKTKEWEKKRLEVIKNKGAKCEKCGSIRNINIHHGSYKKKYNEPLRHLFVLCYDCHSEFHIKYKMGKSMLCKTLNFIHGKGRRKKNPILASKYKT